MLKISTRKNKIQSKRKNKNRNKQKNLQNQNKPNAKTSPNKHYLISFTKTTSGQAFYTSICHESDQAGYNQRYSREVITLSNSLTF